MNLETIRHSFHLQFLNHRNVDALINTDNFSIAFKCATGKEQETVTLYIEKADKKFLQSFVAQKLQTLTPFHRLGVRALREIAKNVGIKNRRLLSKSTLIEEIEDVAKRLKEGS